jgi:hypothetical protein
MIQGRDLEFPGDGPRPSVYGVEMKGHECFCTLNPHDHPTDDYSGTTTLVSDDDQQSFLLLPVNPHAAENSTAAVRVIELTRSAG